MEIKETDVDMHPKQTRLIEGELTNVIVFKHINSHYSIVRVKDEHFE